MAKIVTKNGSNNGMCIFLLIFDPRPSQHMWNIMNEEIFFCHQQFTFRDNLHWFTVFERSDTRWPF